MSPTSTNTSTQMQQSNSASSGWDTSVVAASAYTAIPVQSILPTHTNTSTDPSSQVVSSDLRPRQQVYATDRHQAVAKASSTADFGSRFAVAAGDGTGGERVGTTLISHPFSSPDLLGARTSSPSETSSTPCVSSPRITEQKRPTDRQSPRIAANTTKLVSAHDTVTSISEHTLAVDVIQQRGNAVVTKASSIHEGSTVITKAPNQLPVLIEKGLAQLHTPPPVPPNPFTISVPTQPQAASKSTLWGFCKTQDVTIPSLRLDTDFDEEPVVLAISMGRRGGRVDPNAFRKMIREVRQLHVLSHVMHLHI